MIVSKCVILWLECLVCILLGYRGMRKPSPERTTHIEEQARRARLISLLGGCCADGFCFETERLEFDHPEGRDWEPRRLSRLQRIARYESDAVAGRLRLLCRAHNAIDGNARRWGRKG